MPFGDRTGPQGKGARTGRGLGSCGVQSEQTPNLTENYGIFQRLRNGFGRCFGFGRSGQGSGSGRGGGQGRRRNR